jgi:hypothetical protein
LEKNKWKKLEDHNKCHIGRENKKQEGSGES